MKLFYRIVHQNGSDVSQADTLVEAMAHNPAHSVIEYAEVGVAASKSYDFLDKEVNNLQHGGTLYKKVRQVR